MAKVLRSHGMSREIDSKSEESKIIKKYPKLSPKFIFLYPGYNFRNTEIGAVIGLNQLKHLNKNNIKRKKNLILFLKNLNGKIYKTNFDLIGSCNYAFPLILNKASFPMRNKLEKLP